MIKTGNATCENCGKDDNIRVTEFDFPISCECCQPFNHVELVLHCKDCVPVMPKTVNVIITAEKALDPVGNKMFKPIDK